MWNAGKVTHKSFGKAKRVEFSLQLIHFDICGPINVKALYDATCFITFIDDFTRFGYVYLISHKPETKHLSALKDIWMKLKT